MTSVQEPVLVSGAGDKYDGGISTHLSYLVTDVVPWPVATTDDIMAELKALRADIAKWAL